MSIKEKLNAMKAPDTIYLNIHPDWTEGVDEPEVTWSEEEDPFYDNIPYIRKDALLEWAKDTIDCFKNEKEYHNRKGNASKMLIGGVQTLEMLIEKLESL